MNNVQGCRAGKCTGSIQVFRPLILTTNTKWHLNKSKTRCRGRVVPPAMAVKVILPKPRTTPLVQTMLPNLSKCCRNAAEMPSRESNASPVYKSQCKIEKNIIITQLDTRAAATSKSSAVLCVAIEGSSCGPSHFEPTVPSPARAFFNIASAFLRKKSA